MNNFTPIVRSNKTNKVNSKEEDKTVFEKQYDNWLENDCQGNIEDQEIG